MIFEPSKFSLKSLIDETFELFSIIAKNKKISLISNVQKDYHVFADENTIRTVVRNLISNALKFTKPKRKITVTQQFVHAQQYMKAGHVEFSIKDTGLGMSHETIDKIFNDNHTISTYGTNNEKGSGLGLMLCKEFISKNGGKFWIKSKLKEESTFYFTLPFVK